jgi:hypothetical protein
MNNTVWAPRTPHSSPLVTRAVPTAPDPRWWVAPLIATALAPVLSVAVSGTAQMFAGSLFMMTGSLTLSFALILPSWFMARTTARRAARVTLAVSGCALAGLFPFLIAVIGWVLFFVMLFTGNISA